MENNLSRTLRFFLERWMQKGIFGQLLLMASLVALVAAAGGLVAWASTPAFEGPFEAIWWAFLRLTDPGYLGDDDGAVLRTISVVITVLGYVLFMGSLIAIMTQWLARTIRKYESGLTPISMKGHVVVLGWTNRTPEVILQLLGAQGRLRRFLLNFDARKLRVVVLSEDAHAERRQELRDYLGDAWSENQIFLRSGSSLQVERLEGLDLKRASAILVPGADFELGGSELTDTRVIKTLITLNSILSVLPDEVRPHVIAEIFDPLKVPIARSTMTSRLEVIASNRIIGRLISQSVRHRGLSRVLFGLFAHRQGSSLYLRGAPELAGSSSRALWGSYPHAIVLGFLRREGSASRVIMKPSVSEVLRADDELILLAETYDHCVPAGMPEPGQPEDVIAWEPRKDNRRSILILGWSQKITALISEFQQAGGRYDVTIMSRVQVSEREAWLRRIESDVGRVEVRHAVGDYSMEADLTAVNPQDFDHVLFLASDWMDSSEGADARTILGYMLIKSLAQTWTRPPEILVELVDPDNAALFPQNRDTVLVTPRVMSHVLGHVALRPALSGVYEELFGAGGAEITLVPTADLDLIGRDKTFTEVQEAAHVRGMVALGIVFAAKSKARQIQLNLDRDQPLTLTEQDKLVALVMSASEAD